MHLGPGRAVQSGVSMGARCMGGRHQQGAVRAGVHRYVEARELAHEQCIRRGHVQRRVPRHGRDGQQFAVASRQQDGDGVVMTGVAVENDLRRHGGYSLVMLGAGASVSPQ